MIMKNKRKLLLSSDLTIWMDMFYGNLLLIGNLIFLKYLSMFIFDFILNNEESDVGYMLIFDNDYPVFLQPLHRFTDFT